MKLPGFTWRRNRYTIFFVTTLLVIIAACQMGLENPKNLPSITANFTPVTIENCGVTITYKQPPKRVVTLNQPATEIMLALGLETQMVGTAYLDDRILPEYQKTYSQIPVIADKYPSKEVLLGAEPDFVYGSFPGAFGKDAVSGRKDLLSLGINSYLAEGAIEVCPNKRELLENIYNEIAEIGQIFGVSDRAVKLINNLKQELQDTQTKLGQINPPKSVFWYASESPPYTITIDSLPNKMLSLAGGRNIFQEKANGTYITVNWEDVINHNPETIILSDASWSPAKEQRQLFLTNPAYGKISAVQKDKFIVIDYSYSTSGVRFAQGVKILAQALYPEKFK
ncbi:Periplasmic binding protein (plasmid) [Trichormus variabilis ATCC 29413]|uniref:Periplasmic binding protein n=2 Tax=Anabaena variabilis TaxID=264691 RepID=Q3M2C5_TRIV2|nr:MULTISPECIES: ABC transporter substrate-binding protein [Nostocaceae]ABA24861.1 Periplasmic binding protein [Trichormus variabilis ATCC 29413]MBC1218004.1 ABC transporter substrate-binding protein [Trichormus variabilis ARAD]MBC1259283.1 ABC transporter substrate-binding protein [Trichormus variabilis V5]MBC1270770.1 ABC transporter substrate-binding protein [Trichormus variabilis FSR]MBC1305699.1 ABC transporter substrate-binding protein [Trichormus variabilis N2B]